MPVIKDLTESSLAYYFAILTPARFKQLKK